MTLEYKITYRIDNDIPINPGWIRLQLQAAVDALQKEINKKNTFGKHSLKLQAPSGWEPQAASALKQTQLKSKIKI